jgi:hypothetical protein
MLRVYYSYALGIFGSVLFLQGMFLSIAGYLLAQWLHVASIVHNFLSVPVGRVPEFVINSFVEAISHGELITAVVLVSSGLVAMSAAHHLAKVLFMWQRPI